MSDIITQVIIENLNQLDNDEIERFRSQWVNVEFVAIDAIDVIDGSLFDAEVSINCCTSKSYLRDTKWRLIAYYATIGLSDVYLERIRRIEDAHLIKIYTDSDNGLMISQTLDLLLL